MQCLFLSSYAEVEIAFLNLYLYLNPSFFLYFSSVSGGTGNTSFTSKRYLARGTVLELPSTYYWRPVERTNFTVGIVVADGDKEKVLSSQAIPSGTYQRTQAIVILINAL